MNREDSALRRKVKDRFARLLAATAGSIAVASAAAPAEAAVQSPGDVATVRERAQDLRAKLAVPAAEAPSDAAPTQLAWWGNWHNGGWHPYWHNWPNWRNWHNWGNW